ncbi:DUF2147 domain-containing protein [Agrobacterium sp. a22-2]|uniref:DUF2147 domain-containing protein n=1 Tax=Agrobacterium sp. a22-2 TaxID=2283840 RepID=UPI00144696EA|nr:DUF2147 domain-containing protein [Agrobacterium sp. a22-2]NKN37309.1 DUF2147 domain-containing protein [Agrobacterium sp. a22-2]
MPKLLKDAVLALAVLAGLTTLSIVSVFAQASSPDDIIGIWASDDGAFKFEMFDAGETYAARVIFAQPLLEADGRTFKKDTLNPDPTLRDRSLAGIVFISGLQWNSANGRWEGGRLYSAATGRTVSARATLTDGVMELRAYMGTPALGRATMLRRVP